MLSGGVDSLSLLAVLASMGLSSKVLAVTVLVEGVDNADGDPAEQATELFGVDHEVVRLSSADLRRLTSRALDVLPVDELWEVAAAVPVLAVREVCESKGVPVGSPVFTGGGADVLLAGGMTPPASEIEDAASWLTRSVFENVKGSFCRERPVPDFYERLLGERSEDFIRTYQTVAAWETTSRFGAPVLFGVYEGQLYDKVCLREAATGWGLPGVLAWKPKSPMQTSSGVFAGLAQLVREEVAGYSHAQEYTDPMTEPAENVLARIAVHSLSTGAMTNM